MYVNIFKEPVHYDITQYIKINKQRMTSGDKEEYELNTKISEDKFSLVFNKSSNDLQLI